MISLGTAGDNVDLFYLVSAIDSFYLSTSDPHSGRTKSALLMLIMSIQSNSMLKH